MMKDLPSIPKENLPQEIREIIGDEDAVFDLLTDEKFADDFPISAQDYVEGKIDSQRKRVYYNRYVEEMKSLYKKLERGKLSIDEAEKLMQEARDKRDSYQS
mgnify:FL=1|tara:strand:+ start:16 stop:321 length:306 start_codon:yes stop_codon:yes gene_type:complete